MKLLISGFVVLLLCLCSYGQKTVKSKCAIQDLAIEAALGDAEAQYNLAVEFFRGVEVTQDYSKSAILWKQASDSGVIMAFNNLGYLTYYGKGVTRDFAEGVRLWRIAAEKGVAESQIHLAIAYSDGKHLKQDYVETYVWASVGKHFAAQIEDMQMRNNIMKMADRPIFEARQKLSESQLADAEKKVTEYKTKFAPKE